MSSLCPVSALNLHVWATVERQHGEEEHRTQCCLYLLPFVCLCKFSACLGFTLSREKKETVTSVEITDVLLQP